MSQMSLNEKPKTQEKYIEKSIEEEIMSKSISAVEKTQLNRVFDLFCGKNKNGQIFKNDQQSGDSFGFDDIARVINNLEYPISRQEIDMMIWEVDENLDQRVDKYEFELMYKRCIFDKVGLEPRQLFNLVEFLMYDKSENHKITIEDTLELLYVKSKNYGNTTLDQEIQDIFGKEEKMADGSEKQLNFQNYLSQVNQRAIANRKKREEQKWAERNTLKKADA